MSHGAHRPLLFLDVDGTVLPTGGVSLPVTLEDWYATWQHPSNPHLAAIDPAHGPRLAALDCDLMWATAWMHDANVVIAPACGLPALPVAELGRLPGLDHAVDHALDDTRGGAGASAPEPSRNATSSPESDPTHETRPGGDLALSWKTKHLCRIAAGRPFVWIDDELTEADRAWVRANHQGTALLHRVDPATGMQGPDLDVVEAWLRALSEENVS